MDFGSRAIHISIFIQVPMATFYNETWNQSHRFSFLSNHTEYGCADNSPSDLKGSSYLFLWVRHTPVFLSFLSNDTPAYKSITWWISTTIMPGVQKLWSSAHPPARLALRGIEGSDKGTLKPSEHHRVGRPLIPLEKNYNDQGFSRSRDWCLSVSWDPINGSLKPHKYHITIVPRGLRGPSNGPPLNGEAWVYRTADANVSSLDLCCQLAVWIARTENSISNLVNQTKFGL